MMIPRLAIPLLFLLLPFSATAETVFIEAGRDTTLIESSDGALSNGSGPSFFVGRTAQPQNGIRRGLLYFDVATALPENAIIESASLSLFMEPSNPQMREIRLHRVLAEWGEGASFASGGGGAASEPGDATWLHTFYDREFWVRLGGHFLGRASARQVVAASGFYKWGSTGLLVQDVRLWNSAPHRNFGWIVIGDETTPQTTKRFASRENTDPLFRPVLEVTYRQPGASGVPPSFSSD